MRGLSCSLLLVAGLAVNLVAQTMSVDDYWRLTKARLEVAVKEWNDRVTAAGEAKDRDTLLAGSAAITKRYAGTYGQVHADFGITQDMFLHFPSDHAADVESYLNENDVMKRDIEDLRQKIQGSMQQFDAIATPFLSGETK
jgi:hypothetical protein